MNPSLRRKKERATLRVRHLGPEDACAVHLRTQLAEQGHAISELDGTAPCDVLIDRTSTSPAELRAAFLAAGPVAHYVLVSSFRVYPAVPRLAPWREDELTQVSDLAPWSDAGMVQARALERELRLIAGKTPFTILRPAPLEGGETDLGITNWAVERVLEGELLVLPEGELPSYRICSPLDLANALATVAGRKEAFGQTCNVVNQGLLGYWGHAALIRDGLGKHLHFGYVGAGRWRAAGLQLPGITLVPAALMAVSPLLLNLGWEPQDPIEFMHQRAREAAENRDPVAGQTLALERRLLAETEVRTRMPAPRAQHASRQWKLSAWAGQPASLSLTRQPEPHAMPNPLVKVRALALQAAEERFLRGEYPQVGERAIGHNAILEILRLPPDETDLRVGQQVLPVSAMPCHEPACRLCGGHHGVLGIGCDGYGLGVCTTPLGHLVPVPANLGQIALLADALASLIAALDEALKADNTPVWIAGRTVEAALVSYLVQDAGRHAVHVDRRDWGHEEFPVTAIDPLLERLNQGEFTRPGLAVDLTGCAEVSWSLSHALAKGGHLFVRRRPPGIAHGIHWHEMHAAAPSRAALENALERLQQWAKFRNLAKRIGPAVPLDCYWDALLPAPFCQPYLEEAA